MSKSKYKLLVMDIDNTFFDWVNYYVPCIEKMVETVSKLTDVDEDTLMSECKAVFTAEGSIEYPFVVQQLPSVGGAFSHDYKRILKEVVEPARDTFLEEAGKKLELYQGVLETVSAIRKSFPDLKVAALTDAPRYVAMWKLNKLGVLDFFDAIYGLVDPRIPVSRDGKHVLVDEEILIKNLVGSQFDFKGTVRILPDEYEKPGKRGFKTVLMDFDLDESTEDRASVLWVGDNVRKDVGLGNLMGVDTAWAKFGTGLSDDIMARLKRFSPDVNVSKNISVSTSTEGYEPTYVLERFSDLLPILQ